MYPSRAEWSQKSSCKNNSKPFLKERPVRNEYEPICATCPVKDMCLAHAIRNGEMGGIWGGYTDKERQHIVLDVDLKEVPLEAVGSVYRKETESFVVPLKKAQQKVSESRESFFHHKQEKRHQVAKVLVAGLSTLLLSLPDIS